MTSPDDNELADTHTEEVGEDTVSGHVSARPPIPFVQSIAQMPKKDFGTCRLIVTFHFELEHEWLDQQAAANDTKYFDGVDYLRAVVSWLKAEGKKPDLAELDQGCFNTFSVEVAK